MSEMIDSVAKAIANHGGDNWESCLKAPGLRRAGMYRAMARAAIEAMTEPTQAMRLAGIAEWSRPDPTREHENPTLVFNAIWRAMIGAALKQ